MCRLSGYYIPSKTVAKGAEAKGKLIDLVVGQQLGGYDATGIAFAKNNDHFVVHKAPKTASEFMLSPEVSEILDKNNPRAIIGHCRLQTLGDKSNNQNNHPHYTKSGIITIHNGVITNHAELFTKYGLQRDAEVDSEIVGKLIEYYLPVCADMTEAIQRAIKEISGSMALAIIDAQKPDELYLVRRENNLSIGLDRKTGIIYFATEKNILAEVLYKTESVLGFFNRVSNLDEIIIHEIPLKHGLKITRDSVSMFSVEAPIYIAPIHTPTTQTNAQYKHSGTWCPVDKCYWSEGSKCMHSISEIKGMTKDSPSKVKAEAWLSGKSKTFNKSQPILKPSRFSNDELQERLDLLLDMEYEKPLKLVQDQEARRIERTLEDRKTLVKQLKLLKTESN